MYNNNIRQIENLTVSNNEIRNVIIDSLNNIRGNRSNNINTSQQNLNVNTSRNRRNTRNNINRFLSNNSYNIDYIQEFTIPLDYTITSQNSNTNNTRVDRLNQMYNLLQSFMNPVQVFPTQEQIQIATRTVQYGDILRPNNSSCPISLDTFNENDQVTVIRHCGHIFKPDQLNEWFRSNCACPICRYDIRDYVQNNSE